MDFIATFRRTSNTQHFIPEIDGLRFFAIITVVVFHLNTAYSRALGFDDLGMAVLGQKDLTQPGWWIMRLDIGVKVFFAISGFVLALPFLKLYLLDGKKVNLGDYYYRRLTRLEPPFILSLLLFLLVHVFFLKQPLAIMLPHFVAGLVYGHGFIYGYPSPINPVTWSLETEAQFYLIVPLFFAMWFIVKNRFYQAGFFLIIFVFSVWLKHFLMANGISHLTGSVLAFFVNFLMGIVLAWGYLVFPPFFNKKSIIWDLAGGLFLTGQFFFYKPQMDMLNIVIFNCCILGFMVAAFKGNVWNWFFTRPVIYIIGGMCYSIYLLHYAFFYFLLPYSSALSLNLGYGYDLILQGVLGISAALFVSAIFFILIEKPCMDKDWPQRLAFWLKALKNGIVVKK